MSEFDPELTPEEKEPSYTPASFEKRTAAWMGIAYVLMLLFILTFSIFSGGGSLPGTFPLFLVPVSAAALVLTVYRQRRHTVPGGLPTTVIVVVICLAAAVFGLLTGVPALIAAVTNPFG